MGAQRSLFDELGNEDFLVDLPAERDISLPLGGRRIVGRRGRERDELDILKRGDERFQRPLPFALKVMGFVEADHADIVFPHGLKQVELRLSEAVLVCPAAHRRIERLIGDRREIGRGVKTIGDISLPARKIFLEAGAPLVTDGGGRRQNERAFAQTADEFEAEDGLSAAGRGDDVNVPVL